jgi:CheY-like chemotaxis protein
MVDNDREEMTLIEEPVHDVGQQLHYEENGVEALKDLAACQKLPCLIMLDLNMPKLNGTETLIKLKSDERYKDIMVVIYSTSVNALERQKCMRLGAHSYVVKPISYAEILAMAKYFSDLCTLR